MASQFFRANVGVILSNLRGEVLAFQRADRAGQWQLPQGGLRQQEEPLAAALREMEEETGLSPEQVELIGEHPLWLAYELPAEARRKKTGRGQVQKFFLFRVKEGVTIQLDDAPGNELDDHKWTTLNELAQETWAVRRATYEQLATHFAAHVDGHVDGPST
jgi:putative (di)nucleoside polyphosphate hydrolase